MTSLIKLFSLFLLLISLLSSCELPVKTKCKLYIKDFQNIVLNKDELINENLDYGLYTKGD